MAASSALRPSKNATSSPRVAIRSCRASGESLVPPPTMPSLLTRNSPRAPPREERALVSAGSNQVGQGGGGEPGSPADDAVAGDVQFARRAEAHDFVAHLHAQLRKIEGCSALIQPGTITPFHVEVFEGGVVPCFPQVSLHRPDIAAESSVDSIV